MASNNKAFVRDVKKFLKRNSMILVALASRVYSGQPAAANGYEGNAIAAAVLGGVSFSGGVGTIGGVLIGVFIIGFMNNGLNMLHVTSYWQIIVKGLLILFAVYLDTLRRGGNSSL